MKVLVIVITDEHSNFCTPINKQEALSVLECMTEIGFKAHLEYDNPPFEVNIPEHFDWILFLSLYFKTRNL